MDFQVGPGQAVMHPDSLALAHDQPAAAEIGQMPRGFGLRNRENLDQVAHAQFALAKQK